MPHWVHNQADFSRESFGPPDKMTELEMRIEKLERDNEQITRILEQAANTIELMQSKLYDARLR